MLEGELLRVARDPCNANLSLLREEAMRWLSPDGVGRIAKNIVEQYTELQFVQRLW